MSRFLLLLALALGATASTAHAQQEGLLQIEDEIHAFLERQQTMGRLSDAALGAKPLSAYEARALLDTLAVRAAAEPQALSSLDRRLLAQYRGEAVGGLLSGFVDGTPWLYQNRTTLLSIGEADYGLEAEPLAALSYGAVRQTRLADQAAMGKAWQNTRGVRAAGHLDLGSSFGRIFFETRIEENQVRLPQPAFTSGEGERTAPRLGFVARPDPGVYDYFVATGAVGYHTRRFEARFGRDRNRWGYGRESLVLSNYATVYDQLQLRWRVWRLAFTNAFARFTEPDPASGSELLPQRYGAFHRLALDAGRGIEVEAFEAIVFGADSTGRSGFELAYLNPFQFYRGTERELGSPDNALLGAGLAWTTPYRARVYGQVILDELKVSRFFDDWWGNKWGYLVGVHVADPPLPGGGHVQGLDLRLEYARLRPYLYTHRALCGNLNACAPYAEQPTGAALVHYGDVLGHPAGPNASDLAFSARYRPHPDFVVATDVAYTRRGRNDVDENGVVLVDYGSDATLPFNGRVGDDGIVTLQGIRQSLLLIEARTEVRLLPALFTGFAVRYGSVNDAREGLNRYSSIQLSLRWGLPFPSLRY